MRAICSSYRAPVPCTAPRAHSPPCSSITRARNSFARRRGALDSADARRPLPTNHRGLYVGVILRRLAPVEHAVVAHHTDAAKPRAVLQWDFSFEPISGSLITPGHEQNDIARRQDRVE